jgi:hypothetical protein
MVTLSNNVWTRLGLATAVSLATVHGLAQTSSADPLKAVRAAIGGEARVAAVRALQLRGEVSFLNLANGQMGEPESLDIRILLPDKYLRTENNGRVITAAGFNGDQLLNGVRALVPGDSFGSSYGPDQVATERIRFTRLLTGLLATSSAVLPLTARPGTGAAAVGLTGPNGLAWTLDLDPTTRLPLRLRFEGNVYTPSAGGRMSGPPTPTRGEITMTFGERRNTDGLNLPYRITTSAAGVTSEDIRLQRIVVNPPLTARDFVVAK